jgi:hypothetical protein
MGSMQLKGHLRNGHTSLLPISVRLSQRGLTCGDETLVIVRCVEVKGRGSTGPGSNVFSFNALFNALPL